MSNLDFVDEEDEVLKRQRVSINSEKRRYKSATVNFYYTTKVSPHFL